MQAAHAAAQADGVLVDSQSSSSAQAAAVLQHARNALAMQVSMNNAAQEQQMKINAANAAVAAQNQGAASPSSNKKKGPPLRRGKWTPEEEAYAARLIHEFKAGLLPLTDGTTLRTFLSKLLNCDPMRISKKFVGSNCIGKQVFRRRTADLNRLTPEQIQQSRIELSDLERRFLERVAQTNRVKNNGCGAGTGAPTSVPPPSSLSNIRGSNGLGPAKGGRDGVMSMSGSNSNTGGGDAFQQNGMNYNPSATNSTTTNPPWLQPPLGYRHGTGQAFAASHLNSNANARAAAAGRALLGSSLLSNVQQQSSANNKLQSVSTEQLANIARSGGSASILALAELQRRSSQFHSMSSSLQQQQQNSTSASNLLAAAVQSSSNSALQQLARNASAHRLANQLGNADSSMNSLMLKTGLSRDQLSQLARDRGLGSSGSLGNLMSQQKSFDALMSLDFQSLQSIDNLANLIQTGGVGGLNMPISGMKNADFGAILSAASSRNNLNSTSNNSPLRNGGSSSNDQDFSNAAQRLADVASANRMNALLRNLSANNVQSTGDDTSSATLSNLLQSMQANLSQLNGQGSSSSASLFNQGVIDGTGNNGASQSALNLARFLRPESSTGLSALRMQDGLNQRNSSSVDDFLSLIAAGDIPHQDASLLNVPFMQQQDAATKLLAQQQLLHASSSVNALANSLAGNQTFNNIHRSSNGNDSHTSQSNNDSGFNGNNTRLSDSASAVALAMAQVRAAMQNNSNQGSIVSNKRSNEFISGDNEQQQDTKR